MDETKKVMFKMELFEDFTVNTFVAIPDDMQPHLATHEGETLGIKTISEVSELLMNFYRIGLFPHLRKELSDKLKPGYMRRRKEAS